MVLQQKIDTQDDTKLGPHVVYTEEEGKVLILAGTHTNSMRVVYDGSGETDVDARRIADTQIKEFYAESFAEVRERVEREWALTAPAPDTIHDGLRNKQLKRKAKHTERIRLSKVAQLDSRFTMRVPRLQAAGNDILRVLNKTLQYDNMYHD